MRRWRRAASKQRWKCLRAWARSAPKVGRVAGHRDGRARAVWDRIAELTRDPPLLPSPWHLLTLFHDHCRFLLGHTQLLESGGREDGLGHGVLEGVLQLRRAGEKTGGKMCEGR